MWWTAIVCFLLLGCHRNADPTTNSDAYCRARGTFQTLPLGTITGSMVRPAHTYSIVARDPKTGEMGVAVQSHWFSVGSLVTWAEPGVGAVATQSIVEVSYGPKGLERMRSGKSAPDALKELLAADPQRDVRQVAMIDAQGRVAAWTGPSCIPEAGDVQGEQFSAQANLMASAKVW